MRVLVTGAGGQVGRAVVVGAMAAGDEVIAADRAMLDVTDRDAVLGAITTWRPDVVVHAAAWTAVDDCEADRPKALTANGLAVRWVAEACARVGAHLAYLSTDYVFDGTLDRPYVEHDPTNPQSVYGESKLMGEREAAVLGPSVAIVRTSWVNGEHGHNVVKTVLRLAGEAGRSAGSLAFVDDQRGCPTFAADLAVLLRRLLLDRRSGIHHVTNRGAVSWYEFVVEVLGAAGLDRTLVRPITTAELDPPRAAHRPANSVLDNAVLRAAGLPLLPDFRRSLAELVARLT